MTVASPIRHEEATKLANGLLAGAWVVGISYWRTGWSVVLAVEEEHPAVKAGLLVHPFELELSAAALELPDLERWSAWASQAPVDLAARLDLHDALPALLLFNSVAYPVESASTDINGDLLLVFEGSRALLVRSRVQGGEDEWSIASRWPAGAANQTVLLGADAGELFASPQARAVFA